LLCNRAGSAARLNQSDIVFIFSIRLLAHLGEAPGNIHDRAL
jgi:hypothetical protein